MFSKSLFLQLLVVGFCFLSVELKAQLTMNIHPPFYLWKSDDVQTIKEKPLVVVLEEVSPAVVAKYKKDASGLQSYKDQIQGKNEAIKEAVEKYWEFSSGVSFKTAKEADAIYKTGKCVLLKIGSIQLSIWERTGKSFNGEPVGFIKDRNTGHYYYNKSTKRAVKFDEVTTLEIWVPQKKYGAIICNLPTDVPSKSDVVYGLMQLQYVLNYVDAGNKIKEIEDQYEKNYEELKSKTLLLDKEDLDEKLTEDLIKSIYPYPFEICSTEKIDQAILDRDAKYAYVQLVPVLGGRDKKFDQYVSSAADGKIYLTIEKKSSLTVIGITKARIKITEKHIEAYAKKE